MIISKLTSAVFLKQKLKLKQPKNCNIIIKSAHFHQDSAKKRMCFIRMRYSVPLLGFFHSNYGHRKWSKSVFWLFAPGFQTPAMLSPPLFLQRFLCVLTFISENMSLSTVHVEPNHVSVPAGETAARFFSGPEMKKQREAIWGRQRLRSVSEPELAVYRMFVWRRLAERRVLLGCVFWNRPLILFHRRSAKRRVSQRVTLPKMQEEPAGDDVTSLGQSGKQSWD